MSVARSIWSLVCRPVHGLRRRVVYRMVTKQLIDDINRRTDEALRESREAEKKG